MNDFKLLQKYHALLRPVLGVFVASIILGLAATVVQLGIPLLVRALFNSVFPDRDLALLNSVVLGLAIIYLAHFFLNAVACYIRAHASQKIESELTQNLFKAALGLPPKFSPEKKGGSLLSRITDDAATTVAFVTSALPTVIIDGGKIAIILAILTYINPRLALLALIGIPLYAVEIYFYPRQLRAVKGDLAGSKLDIGTYAKERLAGTEMIRACGQERNELLSLGALVSRHDRIVLRDRLSELARDFAGSITLTSWSIFLVWYLSCLVIGNKESIGEMIALMFFFGQLEAPVRSVIIFANRWNNSLASAGRIDEILASRSQNASKTWHIAFKETAHRRIPHDIEVQFRPHEVSAIVGTTNEERVLIREFLPHSFAPSDGVLMIDGHEISEVRTHALKGKTGIITQGTTLFDGTVIDNILYGNQGMERGDAMRAARQAHADTFIERLVGGYDAPVGVGGSLLTLGQQRQIAIARALLSNPSIIIINEAVSNPGEEDEYFFSGIIDSLKQTKTVIVISTRLSTIRAADNIIVFQDGRFVEQGQFEELFEKHGSFYRFYWRQFGGLAAFRRQLDVELERSGRYGSKFCLAVCKVRNYDFILSKDGARAADKYVESIDLLLKKSMRLGDNSAVLDGDTILLLLPEIDLNQLILFFKRIQKTADIFMAGTEVAKMKFKTAEELLRALNDAAIKGASTREPYNVIPIDNL